MFPYFVWGDRRQNAGSLGFDPTGWTRAISFFLHVYFHPLHELTHKTVTQSYDHYNNTFICRGPIKASYRYTVDTINLRFFFSQICQLKHISSPAEQNQKIHSMEAEFFYNGGWNLHCNGWIENKYLIVRIADIFP